MLDTVTSVYMQFIALSQQNPVVAGAVSLWGLGVLTMMFRNIPAQVFSFIKRQCITSLTFNNSGWGHNASQFLAFMDWYHQQPNRNFSRSLAMECGHEISSVTVGPGYGYHFFLFESRLFWFRKNKLQSNGSNLEKEEINIYTLGRDHAVFERLVEQFRWKPKSDEQYLYRYASSWECFARFRPRSLDSVIIDRRIKAELIAAIDEFMGQADWYYSKGLSYKFNCALHGIPGTGKTSLIRALASYYKRHLYQINLNDFSNSTFQAAFLSIPKGSFVLIEDFDDSSSVNTRHLPSLRSSSEGEAPVAGYAKGEAEPLTLKETQTKAAELFPLTMSTVLNTLDGIAALDGLVIFMTTNALDQIDPAVLRKGRVNKIYELGELTHVEVVEYIHLMFPNYVLPPHLAFANIVGCDLEDLFLNNKHDAEAFVASIPTLLSLGDLARALKTKIHAAADLDEICARA